MIDADAAYRLLAATVEQARRDLAARGTPPASRISAWQLFLAIGEVHGYVDGPEPDYTGGAQTCRNDSSEIQPARGGMHTGASRTRTTPTIGGKSRYA